MLDTDPNAGFTIADIYSTNVPELRRFALNLARDADRAEDLVSDTLLKAMSHMSLLEQLNPYQRRAWLYRTLKNRFIDEQRSRNDGDPSVRIHLHFPIQSAGRIMNFRLIC